MPLITEQAPPHAFPAWPMNCLTFYCHLADDYGRFMQRLGGVADPAQAARAEGDYGVSVMHDAMQAWYDLALSPFTAMAKVAAGPAPAVAEPGADEAPVAKTA
jgi:hypothetical protein